jgi:transcriptional regulator with XRE-family HTH domain
MLDRRVNDAIPGVPYAVPVETMGDRIRRLREAQGLTQPALAELCGVTKGAVSQWELGGTQNIKLEPWLKLIAALHTSAEYLLRGETPSSSGRYKTVKKPPDSGS